MPKVKEEKNQDIRVKNTPVFKLKSKPKKHFQMIHLVNQFGFVPEVLIFERVLGMKNEFMVRAILTQEELEKEEKMLAKTAKVIKPKAKIKTLKQA